MFKREKSEKAAASVSKNLDRAAGSAAKNLDRAVKAVNAKKDKK